MLYHPALSVLRGTLQSITSENELALIFGLTEKMDAMYWKQQFRMVENRFMCYLFSKLGIQLETDIEDLNGDDIERMLDLAEQKLDSGFSYPLLRQWWKAEGESLSDAAHQRRKARERISRTFLVALLFFKGSRPLYLMVDSAGQPDLTEHRDDGEPFFINDEQELEKSALVDRAGSSEFTPYLEEFGATHLKLLPSSI